MPTDPWHPIEERRADSDSLHIIADVFAFIGGLGVMVCFAIIGYALVALYFQGCPS